MIKTLLRHVILDTAVNNVFERVSMNVLNKVPTTFMTECGPALLKKWRPVLECNLIENTLTSNAREMLAICLENQARFNRNFGSSKGTSGALQQYALPIIAQSFGRHSSWWQFAEYDPKYYGTVTAGNGFPDIETMVESLGYQIEDGLCGRCVVSPMRGILLKFNNDSVDCHM